MSDTLALNLSAHFGYHRNMNASFNLPQGADDAVSNVAACLAEPARTRMLCCLMDGHARTATELASVGDIAASTASGHLARLVAQGLIKCLVQGRHRYYSLASHDVGTAIESLLVLAGHKRTNGFNPTTPEPLREARRCYDHLAGFWGVRLHDHALKHGWIVDNTAEPRAYTLTNLGTSALQELGVDVAAATVAKRRRLACACMDWSERRVHLGGALGAAWLTCLLERKWFTADLDSRILRLTKTGRNRMDALLNTPQDERP